ncbi:MAG: hypothetical protein MK116_10085 [Phycisphaerales bacterium]|nr:hypothetical protein [Phycisphaerales bacterium]
MSSSHGQSKSCECDDPEVAQIAAQLMTDTQLKQLISAWDDLPDAVRAGIIAMVKAATPEA